MPSQKTRVLFVLNRADVVTASVRGLQFERLLSQHPLVDVEFAMRTPSWLTKVGRLWPQRRYLRTPMDAVERMTIRRSENAICRRAKSFDIVHLATVPSYRLFSKLQQQSATISLDIVDALWLPWFRKWGWDRLEEMLASAHAVICENDCTAEFAKRHSQHVSVFPDSPQLDAFDQHRNTIQRPEDQIRLGWIGGKDTADSLYKIYEPLEQLFAENPSLHLRILGAPEERLPRFSNVRHSTVERYDRDIMIRETLQMHIGMFPQFNVEEQLNRGTLKAKIYMSGGAAAVCEDIGENRELIQDGHNGMLASAPEQWLEKLRQLSSDTVLRQRIADKGLETIRQQFTAEKCLDKLIEAWIGASDRAATDSRGSGGQQATRNGPKSDESDIIENDGLKGREP